MEQTGILGVDKVFTATTQEHGTNLAEVRIVPAEEVPLLWMQMLPILEEKGERLLTVFSEEEVFRLLCSGNMDLWWCARPTQVDGFVLCGWEVHVRARYYHILHALGSGLELYLDKVLSAVEKYAFLLEARDVVVEGRHGWARLLAKRGYAMPTVRLRKNMPRTWGH